MRPGLAWLDVTDPVELCARKQACKGMGRVQRSGRIVLDGEAKKMGESGIVSPT